MRYVCVVWIYHVMHAIWMSMDEHMRLQTMQSVYDEYMTHPYGMHDMIDSHDAYISHMWHDFNKFKSQTHPFHMNDMTDIHDAYMSHMWHNGIVCRLISITICLIHFTYITWFLFLFLFLFLYDAYISHMWHDFRCQISDFKLIHFTCVRWGGYGQ